MNDFFFLMWKPLLACLILTGIHTYLGLHVVERKVIFVDLSLAQIAALGATLAYLLGYDLHGKETYFSSLTATFVGAFIFSITRTKHEKIPHEAIIGIVFAVSAALSILIVSSAAEGDEHIRHMLVGNILLVNEHELWQMAILYSLVGLLHWKFQKQFSLISTQPEEAYRQGLRVRWWDLLFYLTFGLVVTSSVQIAGVLLVFSFLIVPAVAAMLFSNQLDQRLILGWFFGAVVSLFGVSGSYFWDLPTGATVVCTFGGFLLLLALIRKILR